MVGVDHLLRVQEMDTTWKKQNDLMERIDQQRQSVPAEVKEALQYCHQQTSTFRKAIDEQANRLRQCCEELESERSSINHAWERLLYQLETTLQGLEGMSLRNDQGKEELETIVREKMEHFRFANSQIVRLVERYHSDIRRLQVYYAQVSHFVKDQQNSII